jgi:hypothetical protein
MVIIFDSWGNAWFGWNFDRLLTRGELEDRGLYSEDETPWARARDSNQLARGEEGEPDQLKG